MRSKYEINVNEVASLFGGGGHYKAAGFSSNLSANEILEIILKIYEILKIKVEIIS